MEGRSVFRRKQNSPMRSRWASASVYTTKWEVCPVYDIGNCGLSWCSIMIWGGISYNARTDLVEFDRCSVIAYRDLEEGLQDHIVTFTPFIGENFQSLHDNTRCHVARIVIQYLDEVGIQTLPWPARSPGLNPIEHIWDNLKRWVRARVSAPTTIGELKIAAVDEWHNFSQSDIQDVIYDLPNRLQEVIRARRGNTHY